MTSLAALNYFPIKACKGRNTATAFVERRGLQNDRRFLIVDSEGVAVTQRDEPALALVVPTLTEGSLGLSAPGMPALSLPILQEGVIRPATVWDDSDIKSVDQGDAAADWLSTYLKFPARLVYMPTDSLRKVDPQHAVRRDDHVSFADGYPILIASQESLDDLNARLEGAPLPMDRFRPNLVVTGCRPFEEDTWQRIRIGEVEMALVQLCSRCEVTTIDQASAVRGKEPLKTMASFRRVDGSKVMFGVNVIPLNEGRLRVGDVLEVLD
jgi:uncharacterized protein